jgi:hypothetical protein
MEFLDHRISPFHLGYIKLSMSMVKIKAEAEKKMGLRPAPNETSALSASQGKTDATDGDSTLPVGVRPVSSRYTPCCWAFVYGDGSAFSTKIPSSLSARMG